MALYWHFRSKEELLGGLAERIWGEIDTNINAAAPWPDQFRGLLESLVRVLRAHPCASQLLLQGQKQSPAALRAIEVTLDVLGRAGLDERYATEVARSTLWTGLMLAMSEPGLDLPQDAAERAEALRRNQVRLAMLPPDQFPCVVRSAVQMTRAMTRTSTTGWGGPVRRRGRSHRGPGDRGPGRERGGWYP